jgi:hypothetical protein
MVGFLEGVDDWWSELACLDEARRQASEVWCGRKDLNLHDLAIASPSSWCVCQFRHFRKWGISESLIPNR